MADVYHVVLVDEETGQERTIAGTPGQPKQVAEEDRLRLERIRAELDGTDYYYEVREG